LEAVQHNPGLLKQKDRGVNTSVVNLERKIVLLGSSYGKGMGQMLQENLGSKFEVFSIFKPNAPLANVVEDVRKLSKDLNKQDHIVIVGGAGNSLDVNQDYSIDKDLNFIAERTSNTNMGFVNFLRRYDKPWMHGRVRSVNL
jgi:glycerol dehydrogenase-like iron-containing ADH family enzyme